MRPLLVVLLLLPSPALAFDRITTSEAFLAAVEGHRLVGDGVSLLVGRDGTISGRGFGLQVTGRWTWQDGFFCRTLETMLRDFPRNCQTVERRGNVIRFRADRGQGDVADLSLR
jgi:hypothetical protein